MYSCAQRRLLGISSRVLARSTIAQDLRLRAALYCGYKFRKLEKLPLLALVTISAVIVSSFLALVTISVIIVLIGSLWGPDIVWVVHVVLYCGYKLLKQT